MKDSAVSAILRTLISAAIVAQTALPAAAIDGSSGKYFYRFKENMPISYVPDTQEKDVSAYFVGGVGYEFAEILPLKPEWEDDSWSIVSGSLPDGITFNPSSRTFSGTPTTAGSGSVVFLRGADANGAQVAEAKVSFDIRTIMGVPIKVDLYAHTDRYRLDELQIPAGVTVDRWEHVNVGPLPSGITANGPYFEGIPTKAGQSSIYVVGLNYMGDAVVTFYGKYTVEDGPRFPNDIADNVRKLPQLEWGRGIDVSFGAPSTHRVGRQIDPAKSVRYYLENQDQAGLLPGDVSVSGSPTSLLVSGEIREPYDTATVRYRAVDSDGAVGYSNWFTFGSSDPQPSCNAYYDPKNALVLRTGRLNNVTLPRPLGDQGVTTYALAEGKLPDGMSLVASNGVLTGTPTLAGEASSFKVQIDVTSAGNTVSKTCSFSTIVRAQVTGIKDMTAAQAKHLRVGDTYAGSVAISGGIPDYELSFTDPSAYPDISFTSPTKNSAAVTLSGAVISEGNHSVGLTLANGDGKSDAGSVTFVGHGELAVSPVQTVTVKRLAASTTWGAVSPVASTVIPDVSGATLSPAFVLDNPQLLPSGLAFGNDGGFRGATTAASGPYGPFQVTVSDYSGDSVPTNHFYLTVEDRDAIVVKAPSGTVLTAEIPTRQATSAPGITQPALARTFTVTYALTNLSGAPLPSWLGFDTDTGVFSATSNIPYEDIGTYGPFTITATDSDGSSDTTDEFNIDVRDLDEPRAATMAQQKGTISGDTSVGETATWVNITGIRDRIDDATVVGGKANVTFSNSSTPSDPAGLIWDSTNATFSGRPTSEFNGTVSVSFKDTKDREGTVTIPLEVRPYPSVDMSATEYSLPRLGEAKNAAVPVKARKLQGFWNEPVWSVDTSKGPDLPLGLSLDQTTGMVVGQPTDKIGTQANGIVVKAVSTGARGETLESWTPPFSIRIVDAASITLAYSGDATFYLDEVDRSQGLYAYHSKTLPSAQPGGSFVKPLAYSIDKSAAIAAGMTGTVDIDTATGAITGYPERPGEWEVFVDLKDKEGSGISSPVSVKIKSTLFGDVKRSNGDGNITLRVEEPFKTDPISISSYIGTPVFTALPAIMPTTAMSGFDPGNGAFSDVSYFAGSVSNYGVTINVKDAQGRTFGSSPARLVFNVIAPLALTASVSQSQTTAKQYDVARPVDVAFTPSVTNAIGDIAYGISGAVPGTLITHVVDKDTSKGQYFWTFESRYHLVETDPSGVPVSYEIDGSRQTLAVTANPDGSQSTAPAASYFPLDGIVFDTVDLTLKGTPSRSGNFPLALVAYDDHADDYIRQVNTRDSYNKATSTPFILSVEQADDLLVANSVDQQTLARYTDTPSITHSVTGAAYGQPVSWKAVSVTLPQGITETKSANSLTYRGYPEALGEFANIVWRATDVEGRHVDTRAAAFSVVPEGPFTVSGPVNSETVPQYTGQPTAAYSASGGAYGGAVTWTLLSGTLPSNVTASKGSTSLSFSGYPDVRGSYANIVWRATDARGRTADTDPLTITVGPRLPLELAASFEPPVYVVNADVSDNTVTAKNVADGKTIAASDWTVTAVNGLPTGMTSSVQDGKVVFSGTPTETGDWSVTVSAVDSRGGSAQLPMPFKIIPTDDEIGLEVSDITTKVGYPYQMQSSSSNTYGKVRYYSEDISGDLASQLSLNGSTGLVSGTFTSVGNRDFDVYVTDDTKRVTSKPVIVNVLPDLRVTVPRIVQTTQATVLDRSVATDYFLGTVSYAKGAGDWPVGIEVDASTGGIYSRYVNPADGSVLTEVVAASGDYSGLSISATDTFVINGVTYTDKQVSNNFTISVAPAELTPDIADPSKTILGTEGTAISGWKPTVKDKERGKAWTLAGTSYKESHDLSQYGLVFDRTTGQISGTPTKGFIIRDFTVTVTSQRGDSDVTKPFLIGVAPKDAMVVNVAQKTQYKFRLNKAFATDPIAVDNVVGNLVFSKPTNTSMNWDTTTGVWSFGASGHKTTWVNNNTQYKTTITDEFGRTLAWNFMADFVNALNMANLTVRYVGGVAFTSVAPTITGLTGTPVISSTNLPTGVSVSDPGTGILTGTLPTSGAGSYSATLTVVDPDGTTTSGTVTFTRNNPDIADVTGNKLVFGTEGTAGSYTPTVKQFDGTSWTYGGLTFTVNYDLSQYGLSFDQTTGMISGTPTKPVIIRDLVITASIGGYSDSTAPFWFGIQPKAALAISPTQKAAYRLRVYDSYSTDAVSVLNYVGNLTFSKVSSTQQLFNSATGQYSATTAMQDSSWIGDNVNHTVKATDEFGRTVNFTFNQIWAAPLAATNTVTSGVAGGAITSPAPTMTGKKGNLSYTIVSGPSGLSVSSTGVVTGNLTNPTTFPLSVAIRVVDDWDGDDTNFTVTVNQAVTAWRFQADTLTVHATGNFMCLSELRWFSGNTDVTSKAVLSADSVYNDVPVTATADGVYSAPFGPLLFCTGGYNNTPEFNQKHWIQATFPDGMDITKLVVYTRQDGSAASHPRTYSVLKSFDGATWIKEWGGSTSVNANSNFTTTKP